MAINSCDGDVLKTRILPVSTSDLGHFGDPKSLEHWKLPSDISSHTSLHEAVQHLKSSNIPVAFPTETVYGLGADATRSDAVKGIYKAKGRPSDNPLIVHICDLAMLRSLLAPSPRTNGHIERVDLIPEIYRPLIKRFWPGPLTILLPNPTDGSLAPEVTAGLKTFGARMPNSPLALSLISLAGVPLAAPSANASTKPSPTTAEHVLHDLDGRIEIILNGGPCQVGVESTVVDGICEPPVILRPGGLSIDQIRKCNGWQSVVKGYKDYSEEGKSTPRAPGMKYKHYSPKAKVVLYETASSREMQNGQESLAGIPLEVRTIITAMDREISHYGYEVLDRPAKIGIISTAHWGEWAGFNHAKWTLRTKDVAAKVVAAQQMETENSFIVQQGELWHGAFMKAQETFSDVHVLDSDPGERYVASVIQISLGKEIKEIAHGLFSALRELDQRGVDVIYVEGIKDEGDIAAAVMNRLRKAATIIEI